MAEENREVPALITDRVLVMLNGEIHVIPVADGAMHSLNGCRCEPCRSTENERIIVHFAFDGRDDFAMGKRKPS